MQTPDSLSILEHICNQNTNMRLLILLAFICTSFLSYSQNQTTDTSATFVAYWNNGDEKKYHISRTEEKFSDGEATKITSSSYDVLLKVLDSTDNGFQMEWTYLNMKTGGQGPLATALAQMNEGLKVIYTVDEMGTFGEVKNIKEIQEYIIRSFRAIKNSSKNDTGVRAMLQELEKTLQSRVAIENVVIKDIQLFHVPYGAEYYTTQKMQREVELPNALGGAPFPASLTFELSKLNPESDYAQMVMNQEIDKVKGMAAIRDFVMKLVSSNGTKVENNDLPSQIDIKDHTEFDIVLSSGWLSKIHYKRIVKTGGFNRMDTVTFKQDKQ